MITLAEHNRNNAMLALMGITFTNPFFRRMAGQYPYEVPVYTIYEDDDHKEASLKIAKLYRREQKSFCVIIRGKGAELEDILFLPNLEECTKMLAARQKGKEKANLSAAEPTPKKRRIISTNALDVTIPEKKEGK